MPAVMLFFAAQAPALALDDTPYAGVLSAYVSPEGVDYPGLLAGRGPLDDYVAALGSASLDGMSPADREALWINAYNALTLSLILDAWPLESIRDLDGGNPWDARVYTVAGQRVTLNDIEHRRLRPLGDPRIHAAVNCASRGCPPLANTPFTGEALSRQLDEASAAWIRGGGLVIDRGAGTVGLSRIFDWYGEDFLALYGSASRDIPGLEGKREAAINFASRYLDEDLAAWLGSGEYAVSFIDYDWSINAR